MKRFFILIFCIVTLLMAMVIGREVGRKQGYQAAIQDAELIEVNENGYKINFGGEVHWYEEEEE